MCNTKKKKNTDNVPDTILQFSEYFFLCVDDKKVIV